MLKGNEQSMMDSLPTLLKTEALTIDDELFSVRYVELRTPRGDLRYSAEIVVGPDDRIILDGDSLTNLEARAMRLAPATVYSRRLARAGSPQCPDPTRRASLTLARVDERARSTPKARSSHEKGPLGRT